MISILEHCHNYVPLVTDEDSVTDPENGEVEKIYHDKFHRLLFGGDQLTTERTRGAQGIRRNSNRGKDRLEGIYPVIEDWHSKVALLKVKDVTKILTF